MDSKLTKKIETQLAHIFARYGDEPDMLMTKAQDLVLEWFHKGKTGLSIHCPRCSLSSTVGHLEWTALMCPHCKTDSTLENWIL